MNAISTNNLKLYKTKLIWLFLSIDKFLKQNG